MSSTPIETKPRAVTRGRLPTDLARGIREGKTLALARAISLVEDEAPGFEGLLDEILAGGSPRAVRIGVTGPPGAGKSSLVAELARVYRARGEEVGILAVDPSSPYSGGALLGDRIRMHRSATDPGVFMRSTAARGSLGGLATTSKEILDLMDAFGFGRILVETVGVGQSELEVTGAADSLVVVLVPESGDDIQAMKAGLMEVADLLVLNKADRPGVERLARELRASLALRGRPVAAAGRGGDLAAARWEVPVLLTTATTGDGVDDVVEALGRHRDHLVESGELERRRRARTAARIRDVVERETRRRARRLLADPDWTARSVDRVLTGEATPYSIARDLLSGGADV